MKKIKWFSIGKGYLAALALAVLVGALQFSADDFASKNLQTAVVPTGYVDAIWVKVFLPSNTKTTQSSVTTINHSESGDILKVAYNVDDTTFGSLENSDCGVVTLYYAINAGVSNSSINMTVVANSSSGTACTATANLMNNGVPMKLALGDKSGTFMSIAGSAAYTQLPIKTSPVTQWTATGTHVEVSVTSSYGQCDANKYWDTVTGACKDQSSCGNGWWDATANSCKYSTCTTDTWAATRPECGPTDTDYSKCRDPFYWYNKSSGVFEKCSKDTSVDKGFCENNTSHTQCESSKFDRITLLEKAFVIDPAVKTTWLASSYPSLWWEPTWDSTQPYKKYDAATDSLVSCTNNSTTWVSGQYNGSCQPVADKWKEWYLTRWRGDYAEWKKWNAYTCNNNKVCDATETMSSCPADCGSLSCNNNKVCDSGETTTTCPVDCGSTVVTTCNNNKVCDSGETSATCPVDCGNTWTPPADWKEVIWNALGLKSYVSINTPQDVIDAAKKACANTKSEYATWPNPSDFTKPATVGVPSCTGTVVNSCDNDKVCEVGESSSTCPADCLGVIVIPTCNYNKYCDTSETAALCPSDCSSSTTPGQCAVGEKCAAGSWCNNGKQCFYPDGNLTCAAWSTYGSNNCADVVPGTKECSPDDKNCIEPGATGSLTGWCKNSMECFTGDGSKKFCQAYSNDMNKSTMCPAGSKLCGANDTKCIEPGSTGALDGWCKNSMECYSKDGTKKYCQLFQPGVATMAPAMGNISCPAEYPKECRPGDKYCTEVGESSSVSGAYCAPGGKQCYKTTGDMLCVDYNESCPKDSKVCPQNVLPSPSMYSPFYTAVCIEPDEEGPIDGWCGGSSAVQCYKNDGKTKKCVAYEMSGVADPYSWEKAACPVNYNRCSPDSKGCLGYLGAKGKKGDWCMVGNTKDNGDGTVTCVSMKDMMPPPGPYPVPVVPPPAPPEICAQVIVVAYNPKNYECKTFSTSCSVPKDWTKVTDGKICVDGKLSDLDLIIGDDQDLRQFIQEKVQYLRDISLQIKALPPVAQSQSGVASLSSVVSEWQKTFKELSQKASSKNKDDRRYVEQKLEIFQTQILSDIQKKLDEVGSYMDYMVIEREVVRDLAKASDELKKIASSSEYYSNLKAAKTKLEGLLKSAQGISGQALAQIVESIKTAKYELSEVINERHKGKISDFLASTIDELKAFNDRLTDLSEERPIQDKQNLIPKFQIIVEKINEIEDDGDEELIKLVDEGLWIKSRLESWLFPLEKDFSKKMTIEDLFENLDKKIAEKVDAALSKLTNRLEIMLDESMQKITVKMTEILGRTAEKLSDEFATKFTQSLDNLTSAPEEHKETIVATKENLLESMESIDAAIEKDGESSFTENALLGQMERVATYSWCGEVAEAVQSKVNSLGLALEGGELEAGEVTDLPKIVDDWVRDNNEECYKIGASNFRDVPMHDWFYGSAQWNSNNGYIKGYGGDREGQYGAGNSTLKIEALAMLMRMFSLPSGNDSVLEVKALGVPDWGYIYVNGAKDFIDLGWKWNEPISRLEAAKLIGSVLEKVGDYTEPQDLEDIKVYRDYAALNRDAEAAKAVEALTDAGIFKGAGDGNFYPNNSLLRSEFGALNQRLFETYLEAENAS